MTKIQLLEDQLQQAAIDLRKLEVRKNEEIGKLKKTYTALLKRNIAYITDLEAKVKFYEQSKTI